VLREIGGKARVIKGFVWDVGDGEVYLGNGDVLRGDAVIVTAGYWSSTLGIPVMPFRVLVLGLEQVRDLSTQYHSMTWAYSLYHSAVGLR
jgi:glycine/D-amino acid oxidase-like deaminating enzyme